MDFAELRAFIVSGMRMQHIYQPVMIKTLLESRKNRASVRQIAEQFLQMDESQIEYYIQITRAMPGKVLARHGIVTYDRDARSYALNVEELSPSRRMELIALCESKVDEYEKARGRLIWLHRAKDPGYVPGFLRYQVLKKAKFRCELCGVSAEVKALDVDHIVPRNRGGKTVVENLQALCYTCNSQKRDLDDTDFRAWNGMYEEREKGCPFCEIEREVGNRNSLAFAFEDKYPVTEGHTLVSPIRHTPSFFDMGSSEQRACFMLLEQAKAQIAKRDSTVTGFNVGVNDGKDAGQTILHCHIHLIPRRKGDVADPRGGIRHIIPHRGSY